MTQNIYLIYEDNIKDKTRKFKVILNDISEAATKKKSVFCGFPNANIKKVSESMIERIATAFVATVKIISLCLPAFNPLILTYSVMKMFL